MYYIGGPSYNEPNRVTSAVVLHGYVESVISEDRLHVSGRCLGALFICMACIVYRLRVATCGLPSCYAMYQPPRLAR